MKNLSTGTGLALVSAAILGSTIIIRFGPADQAAHAATPMEAAKAIAAASTAQVAPTIVWYGVTSSASDGQTSFFRAWSDGRVEAKRGSWYYSQDRGTCVWGNQVNPQCSGWFIVSDASQGYSAAADLDFNGKVDGADLGMVLANWGDAPRHDIPPSDCPLNLINPR